MVSETQAKGLHQGTWCLSLWIQLVKDSPSVLSLGRLCNDTGYYYSWPTRETPRLSNSKKVIERNTENFVTTKHKAVPSIEFSTAMGNLEREQEVDDTMLDLLQPFTEGLEEQVASSSTPTARGGPKHEVVEEQSLDEKLPSVVTDAVGDTLAEDTKSKKSIIGSPPRGSHHVFTHYPKDPKCEVCN